MDKINHQMKKTIGKKTLIQSIWDFIGIPFRLVLFDQKWLYRCKWTTLEEERMNIVLPHIRGYLLDIGAGPNALVRRYGNGVGVDVLDWGGGGLIVEDTSKLPFPDNSFDTVTIIAALNHISNRQSVLHEVRRVIKPEGRLILTMINPVLGDIGHAIWWYSEDKQRGGMAVGEVGGIWTKDLVGMCSEEGFTLEIHRRFVYGMNNFYIFKIQK
nr:methyltransferase domain-containing protein [uncultured Methanoregula sp.]